MEEIPNTHVHNIENLLNCHDNTAALILNRQISPIRSMRETFKHIWRHAKVRIAIDGGANRLYDLIKEENLEDFPIPHLLTGDFDSILNTVKEYFHDKGSTVIPTPDQNATDFTKALKELKKYVNNCQVEIEKIIVFCAHSGRIDQIFANINTLFLVKNLLPNASTYILGEECLSTLLSPGNHIIELPEEPTTLATDSEGQLSNWCGLIPVGESCDSITTTGLKWNLANDRSEFGHLVSTSNQYVSDKVTVNSSSSLLFTMGLLQFLPPR